MRVHGLRCSKTSAQPRHIVAGERFQWSREERRFQRECFSRAWFTPVSHRTSRAEERNGGFGFQTKVKDRFLNQRTWTCWYSCRENMQVLSATDSLVWLVVLFSFEKLIFAVYLTLHYGGFPYFFKYYYYLIPQCLLNILLCISRYNTACDVSYAMPRLIRFC